MKDLKKKKDEELIPEILKNPDIYSEIISRYQKKLIKYILRISNIREEDAEDLCQDVFLSAYENLNSFNPKLSFSSWIYRIAHNKTINFWKKHQNEEKTINLEDNLFVVETVFFENTVQKDIEQIANEEFIEQVLSRMKDEYRQVLVLKFLEGKDYREISDIFQKPMGSIATMINRAKKQFRKEVEKIEAEREENKKEKK